MSQAIRLVIAGGGTGGHVLPAIAVVEELASRQIPADLLWIGSHSGVEIESAQRYGIPYRSIQTGKLRRYVDLENVIDTLRLPVGLAQAWSILRKFRPDVILSTGGFVSVPTVIAGTRVAPILTHEQTAVLGLATNINLRFADVLAVSYERTKDQLTGCRKRVVCTGNPTRSSLHQGDPEKARERFGFAAGLPLVYVTGGARGASPINERIEALLPDLLDVCQVLHQTGSAAANPDAARLRNVREALPPKLKARYVVVEFVGEELPDVYAAADLIVGRAGAGTVAELAALGKPGLLIPLPGSGRGEQMANARLLADAGAAIVISQEEATPARLQSEIRALLNDRERLQRMAASARGLAFPEAAAHLVDELLGLVSKAPSRQRLRPAPRESLR